MNIASLTGVQPTGDVTQMLSQRLESLRWELVSILFGKLEHVQISANNTEFMPEHVYDRADGQILRSIEIRLFCRTSLKIDQETKC